MAVQNDLHQRIQVVLARRGRDWPWLYKHLKVSKQAASNWRVRGIPAKRQQEIASLLDVSLDWLVSGQLDDHQPKTAQVHTVRAEPVKLRNLAGPLRVGADEASSARLVEVKGLARLIDGGDGMYEFAAVEGAGRLQALVTDARAYALRVRGDELYPALRDGHYVVVEPSLPCVPGELVAVTTADGAHYIGELVADRPDAVVVTSAKGGAKRTFERPELVSVHAITSIVAPSRWRQA